MQQTSALYQELIASENHWFETTLAIGDSGRLIDNIGDVITFGGTAILVDTGGPDSGFGESTLMSLKTSHAVFNQNAPVVGSAVSGEIDITMIEPAGTIPPMARLAPYVRVTDGVRVSEWLPKGVYYIDTRYTSHNDNGLDILTIHGYDSMLMFDEDYPSDDEHDYPMLDTDMVQHIANSINISVDPRTFERMNKGYMFPLPVGYSSREMLGFIAGAYGGNFVISDENQLLLIKLGDLPAETNYLVDSQGDVIVFGIIVPDEYQTVEYLESNGNQYINTGADADSFDVDFQYTVQYSGSTLHSVIDSRSSSSTQILGVSHWAGKLVPAPPDVAVADVDTNRHRVQNGSYFGNTLYYDGAAFTTYSSYSVTNNNVYLFASNRAGTLVGRSSCRIYSVKLYKNGDLVRDMVPCVRISDSAAGMWDNITHAFYTNSGTGAFTHGSETEGVRILV